MDILLLFSKNLILQALQHKKMSSKENVVRMRFPITQSQQYKGQVPFMDLSPSLIYFSEELGSNRDPLQLEDQFQNHLNHP